VEAKAAVAHRSAHQCHHRTQSVIRRRPPHPARLTGDGKIAFSHTFVADAFTTYKKSRCDVKFVRWFVRKNRALSMSKKDDELKVTDGAYNLTCVKVIFKLVKQMQGWGDERIKKIVAYTIPFNSILCSSPYTGCLTQTSGVRT
jgi:hypothetical protein